MGSVTNRRNMMSFQEFIKERGLEGQNLHAQRCQYRAYLQPLEPFHKG